MGFFFQAEDGIRDYKVTGVQTCALPISTTRNNMGDSALMGVRAIQSHQKPDLMDDTSVMSNQIPRKQEKASKAKQ